MATELASAIRLDLPSQGWTLSDEEPGSHHTIGTGLYLNGDSLPVMMLGLSGPALAISAVDGSVWTAQLEQLGRTVRVPVRAVLARPLLSAAEVVRLRIGDVIPIRASDRVTLLAGRHRVAAGRRGECDGHNSVRIDPVTEEQR